MKKVFTNRAILPAYFGQNQPYGRTSNSSMFFEGDKMFSYGYHYTLARIVLPGVVLISERDSSVTTNKHNGALRWFAETEGFKVIEVENVNARSFAEHADNIARLRELARTSNGKATRARSDWMREAHRKDEGQYLNAIFAYREMVGTLVMQMGLRVEEAKRAA